MAAANTIIPRFWRAPKIAADGVAPRERSIANIKLISPDDLQTAAMFTRAAYHVKGYEASLAKGKTASTVMSSRSADPSYNVLKIQTGPFTDQDPDGRNYALIKSFSLPNGGNVKYAVCNLGGSRCGLVHKGFYDRYMSIRDDIIQTMANNEETQCNGRPMNVIVTGHSLGGALATLAAYDIAKQSNLVPSGQRQPIFPQMQSIKGITFAGPQVGDNFFRNFFNTIFNQNPNLQFSRVVHLMPDRVGEDIVSGGQILLKSNSSLSTTDGAPARHVGREIGIVCTTPDKNGCVTLGPGQGFYQIGRGGAPVQKSASGLVPVMKKFAPLHSMPKIVCDLPKDMESDWSIMGKSIRAQNVCGTGGGTGGDQEPDNNAVVKSPGQAWSSAFKGVRAQQGLMLGGPRTGPGLGGQGNFRGMQGTQNAINIWKATSPSFQLKDLDHDTQYMDATLDDAVIPYQADTGDIDADIDMASIEDVLDAQEVAMEGHSTLVDFHQASNSVHASVAEHGQLLL
eukprot:tig00021234_g19390.t1